ncbi:MAG TPA: hypothetical protein VGR96_11135 [Acidobacteriaceae bacterium]|nr:hypothetical protein [Acidobacteriaceae bacterium]
MLRTEIIAQIDAEIGLLQRAREILAGAPGDFKKTANTKTRKTTSAVRKSSSKRVKPAPAGTQVQAAAAAPAPLPAEPLQVKRVPPKRRIERRHVASSGSETAGKPPAALSGSVPFGPVAVSANEARSAQRTTVAPPPPAPAVRPEGGSERTLGSLIQALERSSRQSGPGTP